MLRKSSTRTEAFLAANRNALKSTRPYAEGKARSCWNGLKAVRLAHVCERHH